MTGNIGLQVSIRRDTDYVIHILLFDTTIWRIEGTFHFSLTSIVVPSISPYKSSSRPTIWI